MVYTKTFDCGMRFAFKRTRSAVAYCALTIKSGTKNETPGLDGIAHMTEHMLFKGTEKRSPQEISNRLELLGGDLNAYTGKEETVLYATVLKEDTAKAADLLMELAFTSVFPQKELEKERVVVIDEINMYKDSPSESIFDDFEQLLFTPHPLGKPVLGTAKSLKKIKSDDLKAYVRDNYTPDRMCFSIVGNLTQQRAEKIVEATIARYITARGVASPGAVQPAVGDASSVGNVFQKEVTKKNHQTNCIIGTTGLSFYNDKRLTLMLIANILGGPSTNSRLNQELREKNALVYAVEASYTPFAESGSFIIYFGCERPNLQKCIDLTHGELEKLRSGKMSAAALKAAKKQFLGQLAISSDNGEVQALSIGKGMMVFGKIMTDEEVRAIIGAITPEIIQQTAAEVLAEDKLSTLIYK